MPFDNQTLNMKLKSVALAPPDNHDCRRLNWLLGVSCMLSTIQRRNQTLLISILVILPVVAWSEGCPITKPADWPTHGVPMPIGNSHAWYGSSLLAAAIPKNGIWTGTGASRDFGNKFWWWRRGYSAREESKPDLKIIAVRLDGPHETFEISKATSGMGVDGDWDAMLVGMHFPSEGCWELRGRYNQTEELIIVLKVQDAGVTDDS